MITLLEVIKKTYKVYISLAFILVLFLISNAIICYQYFANNFNNEVNLIYYHYSKEL